MRSSELYSYAFQEKSNLSLLNKNKVTFERNLGTILACSFKLPKIIDLEKALCFPLSPVPLSLANPDGSPCKTTKSQLNKILIANFDLKKKHHLIKDLLNVTTLI